MERAFAQKIFTTLFRLIMNKQYGSFEEIDQRLKILSLQREIDIENLKLKLSHAKAYLSPAQLLGGLRGTLQQIAISFAVQKLSRVFRKGGHTPND